LFLVGPGGVGKVERATDPNWYSVKSCTIHSPVWFEKVSLALRGSSRDGDFIQIKIGLYILTLSNCSSFTLTTKV